MHVLHNTTSRNRILESLSALLWAPQISFTIVFFLILAVNKSIWSIRPRDACKVTVTAYLLSSLGATGFSKRALWYRVVHHDYLTSWISPLTFATKSTSNFRIVYLTESCSVSSRSLVWQAPASRPMLWPRRRLRRKLSHVERAAAMLCCGRRKVTGRYLPCSVALSVFF